MSNQIGIAQAAKIKEVSTKTIYTWIRENKLPAVQLQNVRGRPYIIKMEDLLAVSRKKHISVNKVQL